MKLILCILLSFIVSRSSSQEFMVKQHNHQYYMCVEENFYNSKENWQGRVIWGTDEGDTTFFLFNGKIRCFYPISRKLHRKKSYPTNKELQKYIDVEYGNVESKNIYLRQDDHNELYIIRFSTTESDNDPGLVIWINNFDYGFPVYVFSWPVTRLCK